MKTLFFCGGRFHWAGIGRFLVGLLTLFVLVLAGCGEGADPPGDVTKPEVKITSPTSATGYSTAATSVSLGGIASDNVGVTLVTWSNDRGGGGVAVGTTTWVVSDVPLQPGPNVITVTALDAASNGAIASLTVTSSPDTTNPLITITTTNPLTTGSASITLDGTASDNIGVTQVTWANDRGSSGTASGTANWTANGVALQPGVNNITVTARDAAGNRASASIVATYDAGSGGDATPPVVAITSPTTGSSYSTSSTSIALSGTASDNIGVTRVIWSNNRGGDGVATGTATWAVTGIVLQPGVNIIRITALDAASNGTETSLVVTFNDLTSPSVAVVSPTSDPFVTASSSITFSGTASDDVGVALVTWSNDRGGNGTAIGTTNWTVTGIVLQTGANNITITARDAAGNSASEPHLVLSDAVNPSVVITSPTASSAYESTSTPITLGGTASDNDTVTQVTWVNDRGGSGTATGTDSWSVSGIVLQSGFNTITVTASDAVGNVSSDSLVVDYTPADSTNPVLVITSPTTDPYTATSSPVTFTGTASDNVGVTQVTWVNDRGGSGTASGTTSWTATGIALQSGTNAITITARDAANNVASTTLDVLYNPGDTTSPSVVITTPATDPYTATSTPITVSGTASDDVGVTQVTWVNNLGGSGTATGTTSWSASGIALQSGTNTITITARDAAGNVSSDSVVVSYNSGPASVYYLSPGGSDTNNGLSQVTPWKSFAKAFSVMVAGDELILLDGTYSAALGTGSIHWNDGANSGQPPSGSSLSAITFIHALNPGMVTIDGPLFIGRSFRKDSYIKIQGITFEGGGEIYNGDFITIKECGFHGSFGIGTNDHHMFSDDNLIEDVWIWASGERVIAINYRSHRNVWRRVLVRGDGCGTPDCSGSGNPNVGITVYDSYDISFQNVMVVDRALLPGDEPYSNFAVAQHTADSRYYFGRNEWLGTLSLNSPDSGYYMEPDRGATLDPTIKVSNAVAWDSVEEGINTARAGTNNLFENITIGLAGGDGFRAAPELTTGTVRNVIVMGAGRYGINSTYQPAYVDVFNVTVDDYNQTTCAVGCFVSNPLVDGATPSLKYLPRIESGSLLNGAGNGGADIGANILYRYGVDGARFGDTGYNSLSATPLWPWPNEDRIKSQMCAATTRGFCATGTRLDGVNPVTLTSYIWEYLGNPLPSGIYP